MPGTYNASQSVSVYWEKPRIISSHVRDTRPDAEDCKDRLRKVLKTFRIIPLPMPGDGNCFFRCISENVSSILKSDNCNLASHLQSLGLSQHVTK